MGRTELVILNKKFALKSFEKYVEQLPWRWWNRRIDKLVFHHTSSPVEIWQGSASMLHYWNLYRSRGWDAGPHIFIAPDGIWLFTDMRHQGRHAGPVGNRGSIGIEVVGRYHDGPPTDEKLLKAIRAVTKALVKKFNLTPSAIRTHAEFDPNSFCSKTMNSDWLISNMIECRVCGGTGEVDKGDGMEPCSACSPQFAYLRK